MAKLKDIISKAKDKSFFKSTEKGFSPFRSKILTPLAAAADVFTGGVASKVLSFVPKSNSTSLPAKTETNVLPNVGDVPTNKNSITKEKKSMKEMWQGLKQWVKIVIIAVPVLILSFVIYKKAKPTKKRYGR